MKKLLLLAILFFAPVLAHAQNGIYTTGQPGWAWTTVTTTTSANDTVLIYTVPTGKSFAGFSWYYRVTDTSGATALTDTISLGTAGGSYVDFDAKNVVSRFDAGLHSVIGPSASNSMGLSGSVFTPVFVAAGTKIYAVLSKANWKFSITLIGILL